ncbi:MAG: HAD family phosphatase [Candidatus Aminicenantes bacterium]|nr:HAD family phosphatase [Candidatus Aminicenantes bacterium]
MIETVVSDLGNVLLRFDNNVFFRALTSHTELPVEDIRAVTHENLDLLTLFEKGAVSPIDFYRNAKDLLSLTAGYEEFFRAYCDGVFSLVPEVRDLYRRLKPRYRLVLLSNTDVIRWTHVKTKFPEILLFDDYILSFDVGAMKPEPEIYLEAVRAGGARPEQTLFIDDMQANVEGAERMGMKGLWLRPGDDLTRQLSGFEIIFPS